MKPRHQIWRVIFFWIFPKSGTLMFGMPISQKISDFSVLPVFNAPKDFWAFCNNWIFFFETHLQVYFQYTWGLFGYKLFLKCYAGLDFLLLMFCNFCLLFVVPLEKGRNKFKTADFKCLVTCHKILHYWKRWDICCTLLLVKRSLNFRKMAPLFTNFFENWICNSYK